MVPLLREGVAAAGGEAHTLRDHKDQHALLRLQTQGVHRHREFTFCPLHSPPKILARKPCDVHALACARVVGRLPGGGTRCCANCDRTCLHAWSGKRSQGCCTGTAGTDARLIDYSAPSWQRINHFVNISMYILTCMLQVPSGLLPAMELNGWLTIGNITAALDQRRARVVGNTSSLGRRCRRGCCRRCSSTAA